MFIRYYEGGELAGPANVNRRSWAEMETDFQKYLNDVRCVGRFIRMWDWSNNWRQIKGEIYCIAVS